MDISRLPIFLYYIKFLCCSIAVSASNLCCGPVKVTKYGNAGSEGQIRGVMA